MSLPHFAGGPFFGGGGVFGGRAAGPCRGLQTFSVTLRRAKCHDHPSPPPILPQSTPRYSFEGLGTGHRGIRERIRPKRALCGPASGRKGLGAEGDGPGNPSRYEDAKARS